MIYKKIIPNQILQPYVKEFWLLEISQEDLPYSELMIPFSWFELYFSFEKSQLEQKLNKRTFLESAFSGQFTKAFNVTYDKPIQVIGASLQPWAGNMLHGIPANNFTNSIFSLDELDTYLELIHKLETAKSEIEIFNFFECYFIGKLKNYSLDKMVAHIANSILKNNSSEGLFNEVLSDIGYVRRTIEQRFLAATGVSMGKFYNNVRFDKVMNLISSNKFESLTQVGLKAGYYDQSHFIRLFKQRSSVTPRLFKQKVMAMNTVERELFMN